MSPSLSPAAAVPSQEAPQDPARRTWRQKFSALARFRKRRLTATQDPASVPSQPLDNTPAASSLPSAVTSTATSGPAFSRGRLATPFTFSHQSVATVPSTVRPGAAVTPPTAVTRRGKSVQTPTSQPAENEHSPSSVSTSSPATSPSPPVSTPASSEISTRAYSKSPSTQTPESVKVRDFQPSSSTSPEVEDSVAQTTPSPPERKGRGYSKNGRMYPPPAERSYNTSRVKNAQPVLFDFESQSRPVDSGDGKLPESATGSARDGAA